MSYFNFFGLNILLDCPSWMLHPNLIVFLSAIERADVSCIVSFQKSFPPKEDKNYTEKNAVEKDIYIHNNQIEIIDTNNEAPSSISTDMGWNNISIKFDPCYNNIEDKENVLSVQHLLFNTLKSVMSSVINQHKGVLIHSASMIFKGKGVAFSAPSGTGKTTHLQMWCERYKVNVLDGDIAACRIINNKLNLYGLPWCGASEQFMNATVPLGAIVFLEQNRNNEIRKLNKPEAFSRLYARCYLGVWDENSADKVIYILTKIVEGSKCYLLKCLPDYDAVELVKECLEMDLK